MSRDYALVFNLQQAESYNVLTDWLDFLPYPPKTMVAYFRGNAETRGLVEDLAAEVGADLVVVPDDLITDHRNQETDLVDWQFSQVKEPFCIRVNMDTIAYRTTQDDWLTPVFERIERGDVLFATGSTQPFRADRPDEGPGLMRTRRISFNFVALRPETWLNLHRGHPDPKGAWGRYSIEAVVENHCEEADVDGLRMVNTADWRIFHVQVWDARIDTIRAAFREPAKVAEFLQGYEDERKKPWERYFMYPEPPKIQQMITKWRVEFGRFRRELFSR